MMHTMKSITAPNTADLPFGGLGVSLEACEEHARALLARGIAWAQADPGGDTAFPEPPAPLSGYRLLTVLGCEIRGR